MGRIARLPSQVANQIAAGEVVARPASVVKELLENALDAEATAITVAIEAGGTALVRVSDDGCGMDPPDALLALERHATSKLRTADDLRALATLGFRGEALPSIASVSRFRLETRRRQDAEGTAVTVVGGSEPAVEPCGRAPGTTVEVRDLFFNVPARRKFLRALSTESAHLTEAVRQTALAQPEVQFELWRDGRLQKRWLRAACAADRAREQAGQEALCAQGCRGPVRVEAVLSIERARSGAGGLCIIVNRRPVQDRAVARAAAAAFGERLERGTFPSGAVWIELPASECDVNVHPQKAEVRFAEPRAVSDAVFSVIQASMATDPKANVASKHRTQIQFTESKFKTNEPFTWQPASVAPLTAADASIDSLGRRWGGELPVAGEKAPTGPLAQDAGLRWIAELAGVLIACGDDSLLFIDRAAAAARVQATGALAELAAGALTSQPLLFPLRQEVTAAELQGVAAAEAQLLRCGFELRPAGARTVALHALPRRFSRGSPEKLARLAIERAELAAAEPERFIRAAAEIGKAEGPLSPAEAQALLDDWAGTLGHADPRDAPELIHALPLSQLQARKRSP